MSDDKKECSGKDLVALGPDLGGFRPYLRHHGDHSVESGRIQMAVEGQPLQKDAVILKHHEGSLYEVEPVFPSDGKGPAKVTSNAYRQGWEGIFGSRSPVGDA